MKTMFLTTFDNVRNHEINVLISESQNGILMPNNRLHNYGSLKDFTDDPNIYSSLISGMEEKPHEITRLVVYGHGGMDEERKGVFFGGEILYTPLELHKKLLPLLQQFPNIKQIDLLACNLGVEHKPGISYAGEFSTYLKKSLSRKVNIRTFIPSSSQTKELFFETESREILKEYEYRERPPHMMPHQHFAITEYTQEQHEKKKEIIRQGAEDVGSLDDITERLQSIACSRNRDKDSTEWGTIKLEINKLDSRLFPDEKPLIKPLVELLNTPCANASSKNIFACIDETENLREEINSRENRWSKENGCVKYLGHLKTLEQSLRVVPPLSGSLCSTSNSGLAESLGICGVFANSNREANAQSEASSSPPLSTTQEP